MNIRVYLAGCKAGVREMLEAANFYNDKIEKEILFVCVHDAVLSALEGNVELLHVVSVHTNAAFLVDGHFSDACANAGLGCFINCVRHHKTIDRTLFEICLQIHHS